MLRISFNSNLKRCALHRISCKVRSIPLLHTLGIGASGGVGRLPRLLRSLAMTQESCSSLVTERVIPRAKPVGISRVCRRIDTSGGVGRLPRLLTQPRNDTVIEQQLRYRAHPITITTAPCTRWLRALPATRWLRTLSAYSSSMSVFFSSLASSEEASSVSSSSEVSSSSSEDSSSSSSSSSSS